MPGFSRHWENSEQKSEASSSFVQAGEEDSKQVNKQIKNPESLEIMMLLRK